ncbi:metallo-beta-lactamase [Lysinibacillus capsici]|uniref:Metallo-beta-lactamase n=1 Tax=Lysinibacillus capsici TaxID=2115968 RepID=A0A2X1ABZ3_9BACI|nr:excalibur calcium-binding domain-containing protein [Lysinibacillus capsici]SPU38252.1 metallo-beta-lactamase [Lysinibacillus capsici]
MKKITLTILALILVVAFALPIQTIAAKNNEMKIHFIDVGQGDSTLIQSHDGKNILVDGGPKSAGKTVVNYLKSKGIKKLDFVVATHPDADHVGGLISVLNSISVGKFVNSGKSHTTETYTQLLKLVEQKNIKYIEPKIGEILIGDWTSDFYLQSLYSDAKAVDTNDSSIVLKTGYKNVEFLLMADASKDLEELLTNSFDSLNVQILKAGHHGSNTSTSSKFLKAVKPEVTILSYGKDNSYSHPHNEVLANLKAEGSKTYSTAQEGTIVVTTDGETYSINAKEFIPPKVVPVTEPVKESYKNCTELRKVYPQGVKDGHQAYEAQHDADNDGWACEPVEDNNTKNPTPTPAPPTTESFKNCTELRKVYPDGVSSSHPAYDKKHDRDGDGWACER